MTEVSRVVDAPPQTVFAVLADGWSYGGWVVGSSHIRAVDAGWPAVGSRIHHSVGSWPLQLQDETTVVAVETGVSLSLEAKAWPTGAAAVGLTLVPHDGGTRTLVRMTEHVVRGPASRCCRRPSRDCCCGRATPSRWRGWATSPSAAWARVQP